MQATRIRTRSFFIDWFLKPVVILIALPLMGQAQDKATLPYISSSVDVVISSRPARILRSDDYQELQRKGGASLDKMIDRMTDSYFKLSLAEIRDIDQIIYAMAMPDPQNPGTVREPINLIVIKTVKDNSTGFDMVTQDVQSVLNFDDKEYFEVKKPINRMYRFAYIADDKTIVWADSQKSIESAIEAGTKGPESAAWYEPWREFSGKHFSIAVSDQPFGEIPLPEELAALKKIKAAAGGVDVARKVVAKARGVFPDATDARSAADAVERGLQMAKSALDSQQERMKRQGEAVTSKLMIDLLAAAKVSTEQKAVLVESSFKVDFEALTEGLEESLQAAKRAQAANNLKQTVLAFHNFMDANGKFPSPVMVHKSGKQYSWRIAILPYIGEQELYDKYDFNQEWDSPHNQEVTAHMPDVFRSDSDDKDSTNTSWFMLSGPDGIFDGENAKGFAQITDGTSNTIIAVEAKRNVHWAKPEDIQIDAKRGLPQLGGYFENGFNAAMADGSVRFISDKVDPDDLWKLYTASGGEVFDSRKLDVAPDEDGGR
jgi:hypothetical protein